MITPQLAIGAGVIIFGVMMLTGGIRLSAKHVAVSLAFGLAVGMLIGGYTAWDAYAVSVLLVPPLLLDYASSVARVILLAPIAHRKRAVVAQQWREHRADQRSQRRAYRLLKEGQLGKRLGWAVVILIGMGLLVTA